MQYLYLMQYVLHVFPLLRLHYTAHVTDTYHLICLHILLQYSLLYHIQLYILLKQYHCLLFPEPQYKVNLILTNILLLDMNHLPLLQPSHLIRFLLHYEMPFHDMTLHKTPYILLSLKWFRPNELFLKHFLDP